MTLKGIIFEDFINYKKTSMVLQFPKCSFKCGKHVCQNNRLVIAPDIKCDTKEIIEAYINNPITEAIVMQGLEPFDSFEEVKEFIFELRNEYGCQDDVVIYTGFNEEEISKEILLLKNFKNIIIKFGRYIPNSDEVFDDLLGVKLSSNNQYAKRIG